jgi:hypothetical protein
VPARSILGLSLAAVLTAAISFGDVRAESVRLLLSLEKKSLALEARRLADLSMRVEASANELSTAAREVSRAAGGTEQELREASEALARAAEAVQAAVFDQRVCADRVAQVQQRISDLEGEAASRVRREDLLSGVWSVRIEPGEQDGEFNIFLDGTLVSGDYTLAGGYAGSIRGTLVQDRLRIERIDDRLGFNAVYYGRLAKDGSAITGTWEATDVGAANPSTGRWSAQRAATEEK